MNVSAKTPTALYITHVDKEGPFLKVWGQTDKRTAINIEQALYTTSQYFDQGLCVLSKDNLQNGVMCCAKYTDGKYYRARITNIDFVHDGCVEVVFLDFGNKEVIPCLNLRSLERFTSSFISLRPLANSYILADAVCLGGEWNDVFFDEINKDIRYTEVTCVILMSAVKHFLVQLIINGEDLASLLINRGFMSRTHMQTQEAVLLAMMPRQQPVAQQPVQQTILAYKAFTLEPGSQHPVYVSYISDGPCHFSLQLRQTEDILVKLMSDINSMPLRPLEDCPIPGTVCVARCSEDGHICRAVVTNEVDSQFKVFYVDFGNSEIVPLESLYQIPFKYVIPKVMAIRFALGNVEKSTVTIEMKCAFKEFVDNRLLMMKVIPVGTRTALPRCDLWDPQTNLSALDVLHRAAVTSYPEPLTLNRGFSQVVKVSYVYSCKRFYVQLKSKETELLNLMLDLQASCASNESMQPDVVKEGLPCCALFECDNQWYRSQILEVYTNGLVKLRYIDYGNEESVQITQLKLVEGEKLTVLRPQAIECCLNGYQNMEEDLERDNLLEELILEKEFTMKVVEMQNGRALVELIHSSNYNVASLLLDSIASSRSQVSPMLVQAGNRIEHRKSVTSPPQAFNKENRTPRDSNNRYQDNKSNDNSGSWRQENKENKGYRNQNRDENTNEGSWRDNKGYNNRNENRGNRENRHFENKNKDWKSKDSNEDSWNNDNKYSNKKEYDNKQDDWGNSKSDNANEDKWGQSSGETGYGRQSSTGRGSYDKKDESRWGNKQSDYTSNKNRDFNKEKRSNNYENSWSPESPKSGGQGFKKNFNRENSEVSSTGSEKGYKGSKSFSRNDDKFKGKKFEKTESSWNTSAVPENFDYASNNTTFKVLQLKPGEKIKTIISWFHNPEYFYLQLSTSQEAFKKMMEEIQTSYKGRKPTSSVVNAPVISIFPEDKVLYRGRVMEIIDSSYKVYYVDFGNVAVVDKIWGLENKYMQLPAQAICCGLNNISPLEEQWGDATVYSKYFDKEGFECEMVSEDNGRYVIEMTHGNDNLSQLLIDGGLARGQESLTRIIELPMLLGQQFRAMVTSINGLNDFILSLEYGEPLKCAIFNLDKSEETFENILKELLNQLVIVYVANIIEDKLEVTLYDQAFGTKFELVVPDEGAYDNVEVLCPTLLLTPTIWGWVSHIHKSTMYVQPSEFVDTLAFLCNSLFEHYEAITPENPIIPEEGFLFAVKSEDGNWYRARIISFDDEKAEVFYLDYGNSEKVPFENLRELSLEFMQTNILCVPVISNSPIDSYFEKDVIIKVQFTDEGLEAMEITEHLQEEQDPVKVENIPECTQQENITEVEIAPSQTIPLSENQTLVVISHIDSPNGFYMQRAEAVSSIEELQEKLQIEIEEMPDLENPVAGVLCAALYSADQLWYRAEVLDSDTDITTVRFVDYGNTDVLNNETTPVKQLPPHLLTLAVNATLCSLRIQPLEEEWSPNAIDRLQSLIDCDNVSAEFIDQDEKMNYVELFSDGKNIKDILLNENLAAPVQVAEARSENNCAFISHSNSPSEFWIQLESCTGELEWVSEQLSGAENFPELEDSSPGALCAAMYLDEQWYRARILSNTVAGIEVLFIDFGNSCISSNLRQLPEDLVMKPPLAQKSSLKKPDNIVQWTPEATEKFSEIASGGETVFTVQKLSTGETSIVKLLLDGEDIVKKLLPVTEDCYINGVDSLDEFTIVKNGESSENKFKLENLPGFTWNEESLKKFIDITDSGNTLLQVEYLNEDAVRLYKDGKDIRIDLGGIKSSPVHNFAKNDLEETVNEDTNILESDSYPELTAAEDNLVISDTKDLIIETDDSVITYTNNLEASENLDKTEIEEVKLETVDNNSSEIDPVLEENDNSLNINEETISCDQINPESSVTDLVLETKDSGNINSDNNLDALENLDKNDIEEVNLETSDNQIDSKISEKEPVLENDNSSNLNEATINSEKSITNPVINIENDGIINEETSTSDKINDESSVTVSVLHCDNSNNINKETTPSNKIDFNNSVEDPILDNTLSYCNSNNTSSTENSNRTPQKSNSSDNSANSSPKKPNVEKSSDSQYSDKECDECNTSSSITEINNGDCKDADLTSDSAFSVDSPKQQNIVDCKTIHNEVSEVLNNIVQASCIQSDINKQIKTKINFDDRIVPAAVSRPQSPSTTEEGTVDI